MDLKKIFFCILILSIISVNAQDTIISHANTPEIKSPNLLKQSIVPAGLIFTGVLLSSSSIEKTIQNEIGGTTQEHFDDYAYLFPVGAMYSADIIGLKAKNHWFDQSKNLLISTLATQYTTTIVKSLVGKQRPGNSDRFTSFPSGHTSRAFVTSSVLYEEFKDSNPIMAYSGYSFAVATAGLRVTNNAHYVSDVLVGAGVGILITKLVYYFDPLIEWNPFKASKNVVFLPSFTENKDFTAQLILNF